MSAVAYQLGGRIVFGAPIANAIIGGSVPRAPYDAYFARRDEFAHLDIVDPVVPTWDRPRVFGHAGQNVAMPPAKADVRLQLPARIVA